MKDSQRAVPLPAFDREGHRGCRGLMPENTIPAMLKALDLGVTTLEMDAMITRDSQVILSHDPWFNPQITTGPDGQYLPPSDESRLRIFGMTYAEVQQYDVGLKPHPLFPRQQKMAVHKPLLADVIDSVERYCRRHHIRPPFYNIETKCLPATDGINHPPPGTFVDLVMRVVQKGGIASRTIIQSFDFRSLQYLHSIYPFIRTAALVEGDDSSAFDQQLERLGFRPDIYSPAHSLVTAALLQACHQQGIRVVPWTVNDPARMQELREMGVDGLISDYPDLLPR